MFAEQRYIILHLSTDYFFPCYQREKRISCLSRFYSVYISLNLVSRAGWREKRKKEREREKKKKKKMELEYNFARVSCLWVKFLSSLFPLRCSSSSSQIVMQNLRNVFRNPLPVPPSSSTPSCHWYRDRFSWILRSEDMFYIFFLSCLLIEQRLRKEIFVRWWIFSIFNDDSTIYLDNRMKKSIKTVRNIHRNWNNNETRRFTFTIISKIS